MSEPTRPELSATVVDQLHKLAQARQNTPAGCPHPPERIYAWWAYNYRTGKNDILCAGCCVCGQVLAGAADDEEVPHVP